jgi:NADH-quinone oxidoreductase subunit C
MSDDPKPPETPPGTRPQAAADKPASEAPGEPLKGEVSRTDSPGAGASAAPPAEPRTEPPAPKPANPAAATTATTSETSSVTGQPTQPSPGAREPASAGQAPADANVAAAAPTKPAAPAAAAAAAKPVAPAAPKAAGAPAAAKPAPAAAPKPAAAHPPAAAPPSGPPDQPPPADKVAPPFIATLQAAVPGSVTQISYWVGDWTIIVPVEHLLAAARHLRDASDALFDFCSDVTATDWPPRKAEGRFDLVYCLYSTRLRHRIRLKVKANETQPVPSVTGIWPAANWLERELYDMFGVNLTGHPDRRRILMPDDWQGFPQRKDYPLEGPGELLMENPLDWLKLRQARDEADIE